MGELADRQAARMAAIAAQGAGAVGARAGGPRSAASILGGDREKARVLEDAQASRVIPNKGLLQSLQKEGITRGVTANMRGQQVDDFVPIFDKSDVLSPIARSTRFVSLTAGAPVLDLSVQIDGRADEIIVIRSLTWETSFGAAGIPVNRNVRFSGAEDQVAGTFPFLNDNGPVPLSNRVIGDVASDLSRLFYQFLPIALLPGDSLVFNQTISPAALIGSRVIWFQETYILPFRPAGL